MQHDPALSSAVLAMVRGPYNPAVANHPNRSKANRNVAANPTPDEIRAAREAAGLTQSDAARLVHGTLRGWQNWEAPKDSPEHRPMHPGLWELFQIKIGRDVA